MRRFLFKLRRRTHFVVYQYSETGRPIAYMCFKNRKITTCPVWFIRFWNTFLDRLEKPVLDWEKLEEWLL